MPKFEESVKASIVQIQDKHKSEVEDLKKKQDFELEKNKAHPPSEILNLRKRIESFSSAGEYADAKRAKTQLCDLEND